MSNPRRGKHEGKPEQAEGFRGNYESSSREHPKWRVGNEERAPLDRVDDTLPIDLTGRWVHTGGKYHAYINQAGKHIEGLIAMVENGAFGSPKSKPADKRRCTERLISFGADFNSGTDVFDVYLHDAALPIDDTSLACGILGSAKEGKRLVFKFDPDAVEGRYDTKKHKRLVRIATSDADRLTREPVLLERHLLQSWVEPEFRTSYWFPLTLAQEKRLPHYILGANVRVADNFLLVDKGGSDKGYIDLIHAFFEVYTGKYEGEWLPSLQRNQLLINIGHALDRVVWQAYQDALLRPATKGGIDKFAIDDWRYGSIRTLAQTRVAPLPDDPEQTLIDLTQKLLDDLPGETFDNFLDKLHLAATTGGHHYSAHISLVSLGGDGKKGKARLIKLLKKYGIKQAKKIADMLTRKLPLESAAGLLQINRDRYPYVEGQLPDWEAYYGVVFSGLGKSFGEGGTNLAESDGSTLNAYGRAWDPEQVDGFAYLQDHGIGAYIGPWGKSASTTILSCKGTGASKPRAPLQIDFSGLGDLKGWFGFSIGTRDMPGFVVHIKSHDREPVIETEPDEQEFEYGVHSETGPIHFPINGAMLEYEGCKLLEIFAATELAALSRPKCELRIDGYADQPDTEIKNLILSRNRAITCYNYIKNILGKRGKNLPELPEPPTEQDEIKDAEKPENKGSPPAIFDVSKDTITIAAHGEPPKQPAEKATHDSSLRRTDIRMNGSLTLSLQRFPDE